MVLEGMLTVLNITCLMLMLLGTMIGIVFGAIPGLSATMAVAIFLPLTYKMSQSLSIAFLISLYIGGISGGLISAILLNIPGTPSSVATTFDGVPMARKGQAGKALGIAVFSSLVGTLFSVLVLMFVAAPVASLALKFGPFEYFAVCFFAVVLLSTLVSKSILRGFTSTVIGVLISLVGVAPVGSAARFTFGLRALDLGFEDLPLLIGLFAVADILAASSKRPSAQQGEVIQNYKIRGLGFRITELKGQGFNYLRSCVIGLMIGILPGIGGSSSNVVSYTVAKQSSKHPEKFGTGIPDGIIASEAANNACIGGALIPLLTLGIPGDGPTAILLGGLTIAGITPGPLLFTNNASFVYGIYTALLVASVMMFLIELFGMKYFVRILMVPKHYLLPVIMALCVVGVFGNNNQIFDIVAAIIFGVIGFLLEKYDFPISPFILGFLLGGIMETYLIRGIQYSRGNLLAGFASSPIAMFFIVATVLSFTWVVIGKIKRAGAEQ